MIVYGGTGVCRIMDITTPDFSKDREKLYYALSPLFQDGMIYVPVDSKVFMRYIMTEAEAEKLIASIPDIHAEAYFNSRMQALTSHYEDALKSHDCMKLLEMSLSLYEKKCQMEREKRKFGQIDARYLKRAEDLLFGELSAALGISREEVSERVGIGLIARGE